MSPGGLVSLAIGITFGGRIAEKISTQLRRRQLAALATQTEFNFNPLDQLKLAARVSSQFPVPGAAHLIVRDVLYGIEGDRYRYIFTAIYTVGVLRTKHRRTRVAAYSESRDRNQAELTGAVVLGEAEVPLLEQYRRLAARNEGQLGRDADAASR